MLSYKITVASGLVLRVVISVFLDPIWVPWLFEEGGGGEVGHIIRISQICYPFP